MYQACKQCFYLQLREDVRQPGLFPSSFHMAIDEKLRSEMDVVIFRSLNVDNFILILSDIRNNIDAPLTANFDFTRIKLGENEINYLLTHQL